MKKIIMLAMILAMMIVSIGGCWVGWSGDGRGGGYDGSRGYDRGRGYDKWGGYDNRGGGYYYSLPNDEVQFNN